MSGTGSRLSGRKNSISPPVRKKRNVPGWATMRCGVPGCRSRRTATAVNSGIATVWAKRTSIG
ncbi:hypothetical protein [uncultured Victivallis sp.]|uniref:hypothetical protein n=1 Tax=uncultured Victivallis sp. TaxID=354118 RepID=UPI0025907767|nr:hypothetical protein [uncultured Victivallis sp.]